MEENKTVLDADNEAAGEGSLSDVQEETTLEDEAEAAKEKGYEGTNEAGDESLKGEHTEDKASEYLDRLQRLMAEFDNFRKRSQKEKSDAYDYAVANTLTELLPVIDNFERALKVETQDKAFYDGVTMIYKQFLGILENMNVTAIEAKDQVFDPNLHNAILHIEDENYGENVVVEELQKGYLYKEKVIRHSMVKVAN